jgi:hypothetical protein
MQFRDWQQHGFNVAIRPTVVVPVAAESKLLVANNPCLTH